MRLLPDRAAGLPDPRDPAVTLADVERAILRRHPVPHLRPAHAEALIAERRATVFDVRSEAEFEEGHIPGSIRLDPATGAERFLGDHGEGCGGRVLLFVCSVGLRSARMVERVIGPLGPVRPHAVANLSGGLFRWHAEGRRPPLPGLHPFDPAWEALLRRTLAARSGR